MPRTPSTNVNSNAHPHNTAHSSDLPPPRKSKAMRPVSPPLSHTPLHHLIYILVFTTSLLTAYFSYPLVHSKTEVGGWWNLALGRPSPVQQQQQHGYQYDGKKHGRDGKKKKSVKDRRGGDVRLDDGGEEDTVERRIYELAGTLGIPSKDLASAIAVAVREYMPPASLSSIVVQETGEVIQAMLCSSDDTGNIKASDRDSDKDGKMDSATGVVGGVVERLHEFVGFNKP